MYVIEFSQSADKQFSKLDKDIPIRVVSALERIRVRPHHFITRLVGLPYFKFRVGDYRLILRIKEDQCIILVVELGHRKNVYDKL